jgi:hypothetical protein
MSYAKSLENHVTVFAVLIIAVVTALAGLRSQNQNDSTSPALEKAKEDFYTIADYTAPEPTDPKERGFRQVRAKRYNMHAQKGVDPKRFAITENRESTFGGPPSHAPIEPALPAAQSDAVVIGEVTSGQAFLTEDKTDVVSEISIHVSDLLKENLLAPFSLGDSLELIRSGGGVRFPSGKLIRYGHQGKPLPRIGQQYLFFLKYNRDGGGDYLILTAYELRGGRVFPLDGINLIGKAEGAYAEYQKYKNTDESRFRSDVIDAIAQNLDAKPEVRRPS